MNEKDRLYEYKREELEELFDRWGEPGYRADQVWEWLYIHLATDFRQMTNLPKELRARLTDEVRIGVPEVVATQRSSDGRTRKDLLRLDDGETVETVLMRYEDRRTACISTQIGCSIGCDFCATGQMGFQRDLTTGEIVAQVLHFARVLEEQDDRLTNVVLMGMGEPLLNYDASVGAIYRLIDPDGFRFGQRRITLSTVGIVPNIRRLAKEELQITLAISLHAATDDLRDRLVPINRRYNLEELFRACFDYVERTGRRVSFEWVLIEGVNDTPAQAKALAARLAGLLAHVNLIPLNPTPEYDERPPSQERIQAFTNELDHRGVSYTIRVRRGINIRAGCGQLRQRKSGQT